MKCSVNIYQSHCWPVRMWFNYYLQVWALHALGLIADSGGPLFRNHVDSTLSLLLSLLINTPRVHTQMYRCLGNCLSALLTTLGPELQIMTKSMSSMRETCLTCYAIIQVSLSNSFVLNLVILSLSLCL